MEIEPGISDDYLPMDPKRLLERFHTALNSHDVANILNAIQVDFEQIWPTQPARDTFGREGMRKAWEDIFTRYQRFRADIIRQAIEGNVIWAEWRWEGQSDRDPQPFQQQGIVVFGVEQGLLAWGRFYMYETGQNAR